MCPGTATFALRHVPSALPRKRLLSMVSSGSAPKNKAQSAETKAPQPNLKQNRNDEKVGEQHGKPFSSLCVCRCSGP